MHTNNSLLPVIYEDTQYKEDELVAHDYTNELDDGNSTNRIFKIKKLRSFKKGTASIIISISFCMLALFSLALCIATNTNSIFSGDKILEYIASDFLGIDPVNNKRNIYEILMSGSFGDYLQSQNKAPENTTSTPSPNEPAPLPDENNNDAHQNNTNNNQNDQAEIPTGHFAIIKTDLSSGTTSISNQTNYTIDVESYKNADKTNDGYVFNINDDMTVDPIVLIVHTHGTEAYSEEGSISYSDDSNVPRSEDITNNIVSVGAEMAKVLNENGIPTLHCEIMHDKESYKNSYSRAAQTIESYLKKYPSIQYVFDVHRDSVIGESKIKYKPLTEIDGKATAQIMLVMGSDYNYPEHTNWNSNLTLAVKLTEQLNCKYDSFTREISLRTTSYNQEYTKGSLLIEIGSCGNTLNEAKNAAVTLAKELSEIIKNGW